KALIETAVVLEDDRCFMIINGSPGKPRIYDDETVCWVMTLPCLREMLTLSLLRPLDTTIQVVPQFEREGYKIGRLALVAEALDSEHSGLPDILLNELMMPLLPGAALDRLPASGAATEAAPYYAEQDGLHFTSSAVDNSPRPETELFELNDL